MVARSVLATSLAVTLLLVACGDDDPVSVPVPTAVTAVPSPTPSPLLSPTAVPPTPIPSPTPTPEPPTPTPPPLPKRLPATGPIADSVTVRAALPPPAPDRDLVELIQRLRPVEGMIEARALVDGPEGYTKGHRDTFWVFDLMRGGSYQVEATLEIVGENAYWYVDDSIDLSIDRLNEAADAYEADILPSVTRAFGSMWDVDDGPDRRLTILHTPMTGIRGYYSSQNELPARIQPKSNERKMIVMDGGRLNPGSASYLGTLAHELQHVVHRNVDGNEENWINEGMSEVSRELAGYRVESVNTFLMVPRTQLNSWPAFLGRSAPHYGASALFLTYVAQHYGGYEGMADLATETADGTAGVSAYLEPYGTTFVDVFKDWVVANYLDAPEGPLGYPSRAVKVRAVERLFDYGNVRSVLPQFSSHYLDVRLPKGDALLTFQGDREVAQIATRCHGGNYCWWGNRGDGIDATLTREFDLTDVEEATLEFWTWYRLEQNWDHAYAQVSTDGGLTWTVLEGEHTGVEDPTGSNLGPSFSGRSNEWVHETMDLSPYAGRRILLRFEHVTDDGVHLDGFLIDDLSIREIGFEDGAERDAGWETAWFVRTAATLSQYYAVQVIEELSDGTVTVRELGLDAQRRGEYLLEGFGETLASATVVVSPITLGTDLPTRFSIRVTQP